MASGVIPRHGEVTRGADKVIDPAAKAISEAYTAAHGGDRIPRLKQAYEPVEKELQQAEAASQRDPTDAAAQHEVETLRGRLHHHACPKTFCPTYDPATATPDERRDAKEVCGLVPGQPDQEGNYVAAVMPWQRTVAQYCWGSRRSMLLLAQTGSGKTVVTAYAIELMQTINTEQGGFLGLTPEETNIALLLFTKTLMGAGPSDYQRQVFRQLDLRLDPAVATRLLSGETADNRPISNVLEAVPGKMTNKTWGGVESPGRMWFSTYNGGLGSVPGGDDKWQSYVKSVESAFIVLDEVQAAPLSLLVAIAAARESAYAAWVSDPHTYTSSPTTLMLSATPCDGGVLHFATLLRCLDNDDHRADPDQGLEWPQVATDIALSAVRRPAPIDVAPLLTAMGLTVRSVVDVGDRIIVAGGALDPYTVTEKRWDPQSGVELARLQPDRPAAPAAPKKRRGGTRRRAGPARPPPDAEAAGPQVWFPALMCLPAGSEPPRADAALYLRHGELVVVEAKGDQPAKPPGGLLCSYCNLVVVPGAGTLWAHTSLPAACLAIIWEAATGRVSNVVGQLAGRLAAMDDAARARGVQELTDELQAQFTSLSATLSATDPVLAATQNTLNRGLAAINADINGGHASPNFVGVTQRYFLGHTALVDLEDTYMYPRAQFQLVLADPITPWRPAEPAGMWVRRYFPDCDVEAVKDSTEYTTFAAQHYGDQAAWEQYKIAIDIPGMTAARGLRDHAVFESLVLPWMPWAMCVVFAAMDAAARDGLPLLYYSFLNTTKTVKGGADAYTFKGHVTPSMVSELLALGNRRAILTGPPPRKTGSTAPIPTGAESGGQWRTVGLRGAILMAQRVLVADPYFQQDFGADPSIEVPPEWVAILRAFYPKFRQITLAGQSVVQAASLMRFVALVLSRADGGAVALASRRFEQPKDRVGYNAEAIRASELFGESILAGIPDPGAMLHVGRFDGALVRLAELSARFDALSNASRQNVTLVVSPEGGEHGVDMPDFTRMFVTSPPPTDDLLTQLLGRTRRLQGLCNGEQRVVDYTVVCDRTQPDAEDEQRIAGFKSLAVPVSAAQLVGRGGPDTDRGLGAPMTAWDVISRAAAAGAPAGAAPPVSTFAALAFAAHAKESRNCVAYLRLTMATYSWKRVVRSSANDFGVVGPRDLDLGVSGDAQYYEVLAPEISPALVDVLTNAQLLGLEAGAFVPDRGQSNYVSLYVLGPQVPAQTQVSDWIVANREFRVGPRASALLQAAAGAAAPPPAAVPFPQPDEGAVVFSVLVEAPDDEIANGTARVADWGDEANRALRALAYILRLLASGGPSGLIGPGTHGVRCRFVNAEGEFEGDFHQSAAFRDVGGVELDVRFRAVRRLEQLQGVARGDVEPESVWFWACYGALRASLAATSMLEALEWALGGDEDAEEDAGESTRAEMLEHTMDRMLRRYGEVLAVNTGEDRYARMEPGEAFDAFREHMTQTPAPRHDEAQERREAVVWLARSPVVAGVFAEDDRTIVMPCHAGAVELRRTVAATQVQVTADWADEAEPIQLATALAGGSFVDQDHRRAAWRELQDTEDLFRPVIVGREPEDWELNLMRWAEQVVDVTWPVLPVVVREQQQQLTAPDLAHPVVTRARVAGEPAGQQPDVHMGMPEQAESSGAGSSAGPESSIPSQQLLAEFDSLTGGPSPVSGEPPPDVSMRGPNKRRLQDQPQQASDTDFSQFQQGMFVGLGQTPRTEEQLQRQGHYRDDRIARELSGLQSRDAVIADRRAREQRQPASPEPERADQSLWASDFVPGEATSGRRASVPRLDVPRLDLSELPRHQQLRPQSGRQSYESGQDSGQESGQDSGQESGQDSGQEDSTPSPGRKRPLSVRQQPGGKALRHADQTELTGRKRDAHGRQFPGASLGGPARIEVPQVDESPTPPPLLAAESPAKRNPVRSRVANLDTMQRWQQLHYE
jgi:hypothetical protein